MSFQLPNREVLPRHSVIIGDRLLEHGSGAVHAHIYPANGQTTREISLAGVDDVDQAVHAARAAFPTWRALTGDKRRDLMLKMAALLEQNSQQLADLLS